MRLLALAFSMVLVSFSPLMAQGAVEWRRPYAELPEYRELIGRLFGDTAAVLDDPRFKVLSGPSVLALGIFRASAKPGQTFVSYGSVNYKSDINNMPDVQDTRMVFRDLTEVRFLLAGNAGIAIDVRNGTLSAEHQQCVDARLPRLAHMLDARWQALKACDRAVFWGFWQRKPPVPFSGRFVIDGVTTFDYAYDAAAGELRATLVPTR